MAVGSQVQLRVEAEASEPEARARLVHEVHELLLLARDLRVNRTEVCVRRRRAARARKGWRRRRRRRWRRWRRGRPWRGRRRRRWRGGGGGLGGRRGGGADRRAA